MWASWLCHSADAVVANYDVDPGRSDQLFRGWHDHGNAAEEVQSVVSVSLALQARTDDNPTR